MHEFIESVSFISVSDMVIKKKIPVSDINAWKYVSIANAYTSLHCFFTKEKLDITLFDSDYALTLTKICVLAYLIVLSDFCGYLWKHVV